jgi:methionyl-tRNA formyltransferase
MIWWGKPDGGDGREQTKPPGCVEIERSGVFVRTGGGRIRLLDVQVRGERMTGDGIIRYFTDKEGMMLS